MCHIISSTVVCGKIVISMCFDIFVMFYSCIRWFVFSSIFPLHNCIPVSPSLKSILKITIFCVVEKPLFRHVFILNGIPYMFVHGKESMKVSCYILYFFHKILIFLLFFYFIVLYLSYIFNTDTWWERKMFHGLIYSRRNRNVNKQRRLLYFFRIYVTLSIL